MMDLSGSVQSENSQKHLKQLCKHFSYKVSVDLEGNIARVELLFGEGIITAEENQLVADFFQLHSDLIQRAKFVIYSNLKTFAFRNNFMAMDWNIEI